MVINTGMFHMIMGIEALRENTQAPMRKQDQVEYEQSVAQAHTMLAEEEFTSFWWEGRAMSMAQAIQFAMEIPNE